MSDCNSILFERKPGRTSQKTVERVAKMGYKGVEFVEYGGLTPAAMARLLRDNGLTAYGTHFGRLPKTDAELEAEIEMNLALGNKYIILPVCGDQKTVRTRCAWRR